MREIKTEITINAPRESVWKTLMEFDKYEEWNPLISNVKAVPEVNRGIRFKINLMGRKLPLAARIQRCEENWYFGWGSDTQSLSNHIMGAHHYFELNQVSENQCTLTHGEIFYGVVPKLAWQTIRKLKPKYEDMNEALKQRAEIAA